MSRMSRGCLPCRKRKVKCDEGRPSCRRCVQRSEICTGYRDEASLIFRYENPKVDQKLRRRASDISSSSKTSFSTHLSSLSPTSSASSQQEIPFDDLTESFSFQSLTVGATKKPTILHMNQADSNLEEENQAVSNFFEKFVISPCNETSSAGFLQHLPSMFKDISVENRTALRWAVRAAAYAEKAKQSCDKESNQKAMKSYGLALSSLSKSLIEHKEAPDDFILMAVVVLDIFETVYLGNSTPMSAHAEGMKQILRLRGEHQLYDARGWSLFQVSHHRVQRFQLIENQEPEPEIKSWLDSLNAELPEVQIEKQNYEITKICARAKSLLDFIEKGHYCRVELLEVVKEMHNLDRTAVNWRKGPNWTFKTISKAEVSASPELIAILPEKIQLFSDTWIAYEWNYHRTARMLMHEQLVKCLEGVKSEQDDAETIADLELLKTASVNIIRGLINEILMTVPQLLCDIDSQGMPSNLARTAKCRSLGAYFLLWSIKTIKSTPSADEEQHKKGEEIFERIREYTGMKSVLGDLSRV